MTEFERFVVPDHDLVPLDLTEVEPGVFRTPFLTEAACVRWLREVDRRRGLLPGREGAPAPNSMHDHGLAAASLGMGDLARDLVAGAHGLRGVLAQAFADVGGADLTEDHTYFVDYGREGDEDLGFHVDDSEVTLNLCLGESFSGAELVMLGRRCDGHRQDPVRPGETVEIHHEPGQLVIHAGRHRHRVDPILRGRRRNLIAWLRSPSYRALPQGGSGAGGACPPWCGASR